MLAEGGGTKRLCASVGGVGASEEGEGPLATVNLVGGGIVCWQGGGLSSECTCAPRSPG